MESIVSFYSSQGVDFWLMLKAYGIILLCILIAGILGRFLFGRASRMNHAITSAVSIVFIYAMAMLARSLSTQVNWLIAPLPFSYLSGGELVFFTFKNAAETVLCEELLCMIVLAFFVNLADAWIPNGKHATGWVALRFVTAIIGWVAYLLIDWLCNRYLPGVVLTYAPQILLVLLIVMILVGALKLLVGVLLASVNPVIGALYSFFFANLIGRQITKALATTGLLVGLVMLLRKFGVVALSLSSGAIFAIVPFIVLLLLIWYMISRKL